MIETSQYQYDTKELTQDIPTYAEIIAQTSFELTSLKDEVETLTQTPIIKQVAESEDQETALNDLIDNLVTKNSSDQATALNQIYDETRKLFYGSAPGEKLSKQDEKNRNINYHALYQLAMTWIQGLKPEDIDIKNTSADMKQKIMKAKVYISILSTASGALMAHRQDIVEKIMTLTPLIGGTMTERSGSDKILSFDTKIQKTFGETHTQKVENFNKLMKSLDIPGDSENKYAELMRKVLNFGLPSGDPREIDQLIRDFNAQLGQLAKLSPYQYLQTQHRLNDIHAYVSKVLDYMHWGSLAVIGQDLQRRIDAVQDREQKKSLQKQKKHLLNKLQQYKDVHVLTIVPTLRTHEGQSMKNGLWGTSNFELNNAAPDGILDPVKLSKDENLQATTQYNMSEQQIQEVTDRDAGTNQSVIIVNAGDQYGSMDFELDQKLEYKDYVQYLQYVDQLESLMGVLDYNAATIPKQYQNLSIQRKPTPVAPIPVAKQTNP